MNDLKFALRQLGKSPGFTTVAVLTLGLVIGVLGTLFAGVNYVFFQPLPVESPDRIVNLWRTNDSDNEGSLTRGSIFNAYANQSTSLEAVAAVQNQVMTLTEHHEPDHMSVAFVSPNLFQIFGTQAMLGQTFPPNIAADAQQDTVVINYWCWEHDFASDPDIVGKTIILNQKAHRVIGVMPRSFARVEVGYGIELFVPRDFTRSVEGNTYIDTIARLKPNVSLAQARAELAALGKAVETELAPEGAFDRATVAPYFQLRVDGEEIATAIFFVAIVLFVLLIACGNLTNLLLARSFARSKELATRLSLGATRGHLIRQLSIEYATLGLLGGLAGLLFSSWTASALIARNFNLAFDWRVMLFTSAVGLLSGLLAGLAPAIKFTRPDLTAALKDGNITTSVGPKHNRLRNGLVITQIAMVLVLLVSSGLMVRSILNLKQANPGYETDRLAFLSAYLKDEEHANNNDRRLFIEQVLDQLKATPGIETAAVSSIAPTVRYNGNQSFWIRGRSDNDDGPSYRAMHNAVNAEFFNLVNAQLVQGRTFTASEGSSAAGTAVINETLAHRYFPNSDPIGQFVEITEKWPTKKSLQIIGVIKDLKNISYRREKQAEIFLPFTQAPSLRAAHFAIRTASDPTPMLTAIREVVRRIKPEQPLQNARVFDDLIRRIINLNHEIRVLMMLLGSLGFLLSMIGIYGVVSYAVSERTRDIGIRVALGASKAQVFRSVITEGTRLVCIGSAVGLVITAASTWILNELMYQVNALDPLTYLSVILLIALTTFIATLVPARRATDVDPVNALRV